MTSSKFQIGDRVIYVPSSSPIHKTRGSVGIILGVSANGSWWRIKLIEHAYEFLAWEDELVLMPTAIDKLDDIL